jgi:hypothetical protein
VAIFAEAAWLQTKNTSIICLKKAFKLLFDPNVLFNQRMNEFFDWNESWVLFCTRMLQLFLFFIQMSLFL